MNERSKRILSALCSGDAEQRKAILKDMPASGLAAGASGLLINENPAMQVLALNILVSAVAFGQLADFGADLARAAYEFARKVYAGQGADGPIQLFTVSAIVASGLHALNLVARYEEAIEFAEGVKPEFERLQEYENLPDIYAHEVEALIGLNRIDDACLLVEKAQKLPKIAASLDRLKKQLKAIKQSATNLSPTVTTTDDAASRENFRSLDEFLRTGEEFLSRSGEEMNLWKAHATLRKVGVIFLDQAAGHDRGQLKQAVQDLLPLEHWAREQGNFDVHCDALWELYLCHSRLCAYSDAADVLQSLRYNVEKRRSGIANPLERAGVSSNYPHLYACLCQMLQKAGRIPELLGAIEAAKGRAVADVMAQRTGQIIDEEEFAEPAARMCTLMGEVNAHYLSFFVDVDETLAVLVSKDGDLYSSGSIPLGKERVREASRHVDPRTWGEPNIADLAGPEVESLSDTLAPLVNWLDPLFEKGVIESGDHICYSPDEHLHQIPLGYLRFRGESLIQTVSVSRTHGVRAISLILGGAETRPTSFIGVEVPFLQDLSNSALMQNLRAVTIWLSGHFEGLVLRNEQATVQSLSRATLKGKLLHFAAHGVFPAEDASGNQNPFECSGVVLAGGKGLPDKQDIGQDADAANLLTPEQVLRSELDLAGSHVTFQACLVGLAREGIGGDALGLDWAVFQAGASSLLSAHWEVSAELSAEFCHSFYKLWLQQGMSRAAAWRETILHMQKSGGAFAAPYAWAAFSLSGDWR